MLGVAFYPNQSDDSRVELDASLRSSNLNVGLKGRRDRLCPRSDAV
jgi:hypothetical protein